MKHFITYFSIVLLAILMVIVIRNNEPKISPKMITVSKYYSYLYHSDQKIVIPIYLNVNNHPLSDESSYQFVYISNEDETKKLELDFYDVEKMGMETYLNEQYQIYHLIFSMPYLATDYYIEDCYLSLTLANEQVVKVYIGKMSLLYLDGDTNLLDWTSLSGIKKENSFLSRLTEIHINYTSLLADIEKVEIGVNLDVSFKIENDLLVILIPEESYLLDNVPIIITFSNTEKQGILNFRYIVDYHILKESGPLIHTYAID